jgi:starch-binding outer membrane protein, SusD/RagB family
MKNKNLEIVVAALLAVCIIPVQSCDKKLDQTNPNSLTVDGYFKTSAEIQKGTNAIYSVMKSFQLVSREWFFVHDTRCDEVSTGGSQLEAPRAQMLNGNTDPSNPLVSAVWNALYVMIHRANTVIVNSGNGADNAALTARCVGEAKFLRAWAYNELVSLWGGVPVYTAPVGSSNDFTARQKPEDVYKVIVKDLQEAAAALPGKSGYDANNKGRATNAAANALLGKVYMQMGDYTNAKVALLKVPTSGADGYQLMNRYLDNFEEETELNNESIFEVIFVDKGNNDFNWGSGVGDGSSPNLSTVRNQEYNAVAWRNLVPSNKYLANFEHTANGFAKTDPRLSYSVYQSGDLINNGTETLTDAMQNGSSSILNGAVKKISWRKFMLTYKENSGFHPGGNNQRILRFGEVLLNLAECEIELGNFSAAAGYLNQLRNRASVLMPNYPTPQYAVNDKPNCIRALMHEKMAEMGCEEVRDVDIMRWRKKGYFGGSDPLSYFKANRDELLPLPQSEIDNNPKLGEGGVSKQNPGY